MNCEIVRDLLPLYHDEVVSEESRELVEEHLKTCAECRKMLEDIRENVKAKNVPDMEIPAASGFKTIQTKLRRKTVSGITVSIICAVAIVVALTYGGFYYETPVPYSEVTRNLARPIDSPLDFVSNAKGHSSIEFLQVGDSLYICCSDTFWARYIAKPDKPKRIALYNSRVPVEPETPETPEVPEIPETPDVPDVIPVSPDTRDTLLGMLSVISSPSPPPAPTAPAAPAPPLQIDEVVKVFYLEGNLGLFSRDDTAFSKAVENAILIWER